MYTLYVHIFPNNKKYVGVTRDKPEKRFGLNGNGYRSKLMKEKISKYGWQNIQHKILKTNLSYEDAIKYEKIFIKKYKSNDIKYGYNIKKGGNFSKTQKSYIHINTPNRQRWYDKLTNKPLDGKHKETIRQSHLKRLNRYVCQYKDDILIKKWDSACEIKKQLGFCKTYIGKCCNYNENNFPYKVAYGYVWKYEKKGNI